MNYIEYMKEGNKTNYSDYTPIKTFGPFFTLTLKRNNWIKEREIINKQYPYIEE